MIRSLSRGLDILTVLNKRDSASAAEIAAEVHAPRATVYRILETLTEKGFIYRHDSDGRFRITLKVRTLSDGFTDEDHMANISRPVMSRLTRKFSWPVTLATISGIDLIVRENTDQESPLATERFTIGYRMPLLRTASGLCILANMTRSRRNVVLKTLADTESRSRELVRQRGTLEKKLKEIRSKGYSVNHRARRVADMTAISVPILTQPHTVRGAVTIRYAQTVMTLPQAVKKFVPELRAAADGIAKRVSLHIERQKKHGSRHSVVLFRQVNMLSVIAGVPVCDLFPGCPPDIR